MREYIAQDQTTLIKSIQKAFPKLNYVTINRVLRKKDIKINGKRVSRDVVINKGDNVQVYIDFDKEDNVEIIYQDSNVVVVNKPYGIEVVDENKREKDLTQQVSLQTQTNVFPCHRLDVNTEGVIIFAKTQKAYDIITQAFKNHKVTKIYNAWVQGKMEKKQDTLKAYLVKDEKSARVFVYDKSSTNAKEIITKYRVLKEFASTSLLEITLETGRTHQIRAHLSHIGHPVVGDDKYGNRELNKKFNLKKQCLTSVLLKFDFANSELNYLNDKEFCVQPTWLKYTSKDQTNE